MVLTFLLVGDVVGGEFEMVGVNFKTNDYVVPIHVPQSFQRERYFSSDTCVSHISWRDDFQSWTKQAI